MKKFYPLLYANKELIEIISQADFKPLEPIAPKIPEISSGFLKIFNKKHDDIKIKEYILEKKRYETALKQNLYENKIYNLNPLKYSSDKRILKLKERLKWSKDFVQNTDYRKGLSHSYFLKKLKLRFGEKIYESLSIKTDEYFSSNNVDPYCDEIDYNLYDYDSYFIKPQGKYVTDYTYVDQELKIIIEVDEPYSLKTKEPYHLFDSNRNNFFIKNLWIILRFCEEQVMLYPNECCNIIQSVINCFNEANPKYLKSLKTGIKQVEKWDEISINNLIRKSYREIYIMKFNEKMFTEL